MTKRKGRASETVHYARTPTGIPLCGQKHPPVGAVTSDVERVECVACRRMARAERAAGTAGASS